MPEQNNTPPKTEDNASESFGLMAMGRSGRWDVDVDETTEGPQRWFMQIEGPSVYLSFEIPSPEIIPSALDFLQGSSSTSGAQEGPAADSGSFVLGKGGNTPVTVLKCDECEDHFFLMMKPITSVVVRVTIAGTDLKELQEALRQVVEDLEEES
jgi:hypothetical protein